MDSLKDALKQFIIEVVREELSTQNAKIDVEIEEEPQNNSTQRHRRFYTDEELAGTDYTKGKGRVTDPSIDKRLKRNRAEQQ